MTNDGGLSEDEEDHKATLWYDLEKEMREIFEQFFKEPKPSTIIYDYGRKLMALETEYEKEGLDLEDIHEIRRGIVNGKRQRSKMGETTAVEMDVVCPYCWRLKCNCACGRTDEDIFRIVCFGKKQK